MDRAVQRLEIRRAELELRAAKRRGLSDRAAAAWQASIDRMRAELEGRVFEGALETAAVPHPTPGRRMRADYN